MKLKNEKRGLQLFCAYVHRICIDRRFDDWIPRWEEIDFKTLREAREYLTIAGENAYIIDNVTKQKV